MSFPLSFCISSFLKIIIYLRIQSESKYVFPCDHFPSILYFLSPENDLSWLSRRLCWKHTFHSFLTLFEKRLNLHNPHQPPYPMDIHANHQYRSKSFSWCFCVYLRTRLCFIWMDSGYIINTSDNNVSVFYWDADGIFVFWDDPDK